MNKHYSFFDSVTGLLSQKTLCCSSTRIAENIPQGMAAIEGVYDHLSQRVDVESIAVVSESFGEFGATEEELTRPRAIANNWRSRLLHPDEAPVIDYQPPSPGDDYEWIQDDPQGNRVRRWLKKPEVAERELSETRAMAKIIEIEKEAQPRAMREAMIALLGRDNPAASRLVAIDDEIAMQRADLSPGIKALPSVP